jgi:type IV pilus assembly protein PilB
MNMGVAPFNIASAVSLITAQRLAKRLCKTCKVPIEAPKEALLKIGFLEEDFEKKLEIYGPKEGGCDLCNAGYKGRVGIYQVMPISEDMSRIIMENGNAIDIADQAKKEGVNDLRRSGILKVIQGLTSIAEVESCTNE